MTAYTSTQSGNWNDAATWGGGGYPSSSADTATISTKHTITVPAATTSTCGAVTLTAGTAFTATNFTSLTINGTFNMGGLVTVNNFSEIRMGPGAILDLNGFNVSTAAANSSRYIFAGNAGSRITIRSTGTAGIFTRTTGSNYADWSYVDVTGLGDCLIARGDASNLMQSYQYCTFTSCGQLELEYTNAAAGAGILVSHCDFINPSNAAPVTNGKAQPRITIAGTLGTNPRKVEHCTWRTSGSVANFLFVRCDNGLVFDNCIFNEVQISANNVSDATKDIDFINCLFYMSKSGVAGQNFANSLRPARLLHGNYFLNRFGDHPLGSQAHYSLEAYGNVFETDAVTNLGTLDGSGTNWFLFGASVTTPTVKLKNNFVLGTGSFVTYTGAASPALLEVSYNTFAVENEGRIQSTRPVNYAPVLTTEQLGALTGTVEIFNNLILDPDSTNTRDNAVDFVTNTGDQVDYLDYNCGYGYPGGTLIPPVQYSDYVVVTAGAGANDFSVDPELVDETRNFLGYVTHIGGTATYAAALAEFVKLNEAGYNSDYSVKKMVNWVADGLKVAAASLSVSGRSGMSIGAGIYESSSRVLTTAANMLDYLDAEYA